MYKVTLIEHLLLSIRNSNLKIEKEIILPFAPFLGLDLEIGEPPNKVVYFTCNKVIYAENQKKFTCVHIANEKHDISRYSKELILASVDEFRKSGWELDKHSAEDFADYLMH